MRISTLKRRFASTAARRFGPVVLTALVVLPIGSSAALGAAGNISRISVNGAGAQALGGSSYNPSVSADGRYVAFYSAADNLVAGDTNGFSDVFVKDTTVGQTTRASVGSAGAEAVGGISIGPSISDDGRYVAFFSPATGLVAGDTNRDWDVFVRDGAAAQTTRASVDSAGAEGASASHMGSISGNGRYVSFDSAATNLVNGDTNDLSDVFVKDRLTGQTTRVSLGSAGAESAGGSSTISSISDDGRYVAFYSGASNLVNGDTNAATDIFLRDTAAGRTTRVSTSSQGAQGAGRSSNPAVSGDGRYVAFDSTATNLVAGDTNGRSDVFVKDTLTGQTRRTSTSSQEAEATGGDAKLPSISRDGRYVAFDSAATNLVAGDTNGRSDVFVKDTLTGDTKRASVTAFGAEATGGNSAAASISSDGRYVTFDSAATNLVAGDTNGRFDVFKYQYLADARSVDPPGDTPPGDPPGGVPPVKPTISGQRVTPRCVTTTRQRRSSASGRPAKKKKKITKSRPSLTFNLSHDASVTYRISRIRAPRRAAPRSCASGIPKNATWAHVSTFADSRRAGRVVRKDVSTKIGAGASGAYATAAVRMKPGYYRIELVAENATGRSETASVRFRVRAKHR